MDDLIWYVGLSLQDKNKGDRNEVSVGKQDSSSAYLFPLPFSWKTAHNCVRISYSERPYRQGLINL